MRLLKVWYKRISGTLEHLRFAQDEASLCKIKKKKKKEMLYKMFANSASFVLKKKILIRSYFRKLFCWSLSYIFSKIFKKMIFTIYLLYFHSSEIPQELVQEAEGGKINLNMERHQDIDYIPPKRKVTAFAGQGHMLGRWVWYFHDLTEFVLFSNQLSTSSQRTFY